MSNDTPSRHDRYTPVIAAGVTLVAAAIALAITRRFHPGIVVGSLVLGGLVFFVGVAAATSAEKKRREAGILGACAELGLEHTPAKALGDRAGAFAPFAHLKALRTGAKGLGWLARDPGGSEPLVLVEHSYVVSTGKSAARISHTLAALPCPASWPEMVLTPEHFGHRVAAAFGRRDVQLEDPAFNKRWFVSTDDETFAMLALGPSMQAWLLDAPKEAIFHIGEGMLVCMERKAVDGAGLRKLVELVRGFESRLPAELGAYGASA